MLIREKKVVNKLLELVDETLKEKDPVKLVFLLSLQEASAEELEELEKERRNLVPSSDEEKKLLSELQKSLELLKQKVMQAKSYLDMIAQILGSPGKGSFKIDREV